MKKLLSTILASTMILSTLGTSFAQENTQTTPETEVLQEVQTLSSTNFPSASQLPDYAVKAFSSVLDDLPHTYMDYGSKCTLYVSYFDYLGNGDPLMYTMYYHGGATGIHEPKIWGAKADGTPVDLGFTHQSGGSLGGSVQYQGKTYLLEGSVLDMWGPEEVKAVYEATMYSYAKGVMTQEVDTITWSRDWSEWGTPFTSPYTVLYTLLSSGGGGAAHDFTEDFTKYSKLASVASAELKAGTSMVTGTIDVPTNAWYAPFVEFVLEHRAMINLIGEDYRESTTFAPDAQATRYVVADTLSRAYVNSLDHPTASGEQNLLPFTDIDYDFEVEFVYSNGIMTGVSDTYFGVNDPITREQLALVLQNLAKHVNYYKAPSSTSLSQFSDSGSISAWAKDGVSWAVANGYLSGSDGQLNPQGNLSRAELATVLTSFYKNNGMPVEK